MIREVRGYISWHLLQVFSLLMELRGEEQVLTPLLTILLGEPEVQTTSTDFVLIELIYETPDFSGLFYFRFLYFKMYC